MSAITFADSLDTDQTGQNVGPDLDLNCLKLYEAIPTFVKELK